MAEVLWGDLMKAAGEAAFEAIPADTYDAYVDTADAGTSTNGYPKIDVKFKVEGGPYDKRTVFKSFSVVSDKPAALRYFFAHMTALGLDKAYFDAQPSMEKVAVDLINRRCQLKVTQQEWPAGSGQVRNQVDGVMRPTDGLVSVTVTSGQAGLPGMGGTAPGLPTGPATTPPPPMLDDLPF